MRQIEKNYIKSGEFAKISGVNKQTLLYYDRIHLFSPALVDEQGYRYYKFEQLDVFSTILALKTIGLSLKEIKDYINTRTAETTQELFKTCLEKTTVKINELLTLSEEMKTKIELIEKARGVSCGEMYIEHHEKQSIFCSAPISDDASAIEKFTCFGNLINWRIEHQLHIGHAIGGIVKKSFLENPQGQETRYCRYYTVIDNLKNIKGNMEKPAGNYLVLYYKGPYDKTYLSYRQIIEYACAHNLQLGEYSYEESLIDEISECNSQEYITQITIPVTFKNGYSNV